MYVDIIAYQNGTAMLSLANETGQVIYQLHRDGRVVADWAELRRLRDLFIEGPASPEDYGVFEQHVLIRSVAAALWAAKNN
jgi:hypothetical protein